MSNIKTSSSILQDVNDRFIAALETQTSWGKEQVKKLYMETKNKVLIEYIDKMDDKK